ncbi:helix-turn-helix transcriptional regulator [Spongiactinospora sp. TRM90649]|uniref:helix-turn-helix domain-containing protein n=1 Tax=Spongiactinospora sp. TRM90649 TaxID=3031114 RepID=UPI0023F87659|nr:helix-turn-helix transcriptional regulator [Spongiactinospora sp. TRM90649]MDF5751635.1 helix-turn-helix transcriptional regulator [Spongiactinospora sp. TRM90649]
MGENELGAFLRSRREAVAPASVGIPGGPRRRTPGLRRAELATLAGVSVEYLTRLEQGRDRRPSGEVLGALADVLGLSTDERVHLYRLVKAMTGTTCQGGGEPPVQVVRPTVMALLDRLEPAPALVIDQACEVLARTAGFDRLAGPLGLLDAEPVNLARFTFTDPRARAAFPDWNAVADERAAALRIAASLGDHRAAVLAEELTAAAGPPFAERFAALAALPARTGREHWSHPEAGDLHLAYESLEVPATDEQRLIVYLPADSRTGDALDALSLAARSV